jgi:predicted Ser/Thr protein kinase
MEAYMIALNKKEYLAKGKRGIVSTAMFGRRKVVIKEVNPSSVVDTIAHEAQMLKLVNSKGVGPLFIALQDNSLVREYIDGIEILDWLLSAKKEMIKKVFLDILGQCRSMDELGINKLEMTHPTKHILVRKGKPVFIDFERCRYTQKPKNVTQVIQWMTGAEVQSLLQAKGLIIDRQVMLTHAKEYKRTYSKIPYNQMREVLRNA